MMRFLVINLLLIGQLSSAHLSSATDGPRKLKLSTVSKDLKIQAIVRDYVPTHAPTDTPEIIDGSSETPGEGNVGESPEGNVGESPEVSTSEEMSDSTEQADSTGESNETIYPTLGNSASYSATSGTAEESNGDTSEDKKDKEVEDKDEKDEEEKEKDVKVKDKKDKEVEDKDEKNEDEKDEDEKDEDPATRTDVRIVLKFCQSIRLSQFITPDGY